MLLSLGLFVFEINTTAYQQLQRETTQRWAANNRIGFRPAYQYLGPGEETMTLSGTLYPEVTGGLPDLSMIKYMAASGKAHMLLGGNGAIHGLWFIESVSETHSEFFFNGSPRKIEFSLSLKRSDKNAIPQMGGLGRYLDTVIENAMKTAV